MKEGEEGDPKGKARRGEPEGEGNGRKTHRLREDFEDGLGLSSSEGEEIPTQITNRRTLQPVLVRCDP